MLHVTDHHDSVTLRISGKFDYRMIKEFHKVLDRSPQTWVVDFTSVDYVDSSALGLLLLLRDRVAGDNQRVVLRGLHGQPRDVLVMARFDKMFKLA